MEEENTELVLFLASDGDVRLDVRVKNETVWLTQMQMSDLFERNRSTITRHINKLFQENELDKKSNVHFLHFANSDKPVALYSLDVIISVGYRVKSQRGVEFRKWANNILKQYIMNGYAVNKNRMEQLGKIVQIMKRIDSGLDKNQVLNVIEKFTTALDLLDDYDHQRIKKPSGNKSTYVLDYEECKKVISEMKFSAQSDLFGQEKDDSFKASINAIYQTFGGKEVYPSLEEKAANLLYLITKNHSFLDGNKRIAAAVFLYFLEKNNALFDDEKKIINDYTLVAITIMIAESKTSEKDAIIGLIMNFLAKS